VPTKTPKDVSIVLLAAGPSRRLGKPKQLLPYKECSLIRAVTKTAITSKSVRTYVVIGAEAGRVHEEIADLPVVVLDNSQWSEGMSSSIRLGIAALPAATDAALILLCDQPLVSVGLLDQMIDTYCSSRTRIVACEYGGTLGAPAIFDRSLFTSLSELRGDRGAKQIIAHHVNEVARVSFLEGTMDIDTMNDYDILTS